MAENINTIREKIEEAYRLGILSDDEYKSKIAAIQDYIKQAKQNSQETNNYNDGEEQPRMLHKSTTESPQIPTETKSDNQDDDGIVFFDQLSGDTSTEKIKYVGPNTPNTDERTIPSTVGKHKKKKFKKIPFIVGVLIVLIVGTVVLRGVGDDDYDKKEDKPVDITWSELKLGSMLPEPTDPTGKVDNNTDMALDIDLFPMSENEILEYMDECIENYFPIDVYSPYESGNYRRAFNEEGYKVSLERYGANYDKLSIIIKPPIKMEALVWPSAGIGGDLPKPKSETGKIETESSDTFAAYVGEVSLEEYNEYVNKCIKKGYSVDYNKWNRSFSAENKRGDNLSIDYYGNNIMYIYIYNWNIE